MNLPVEWTSDGTAFVIRNKDELVKKWLPLFFSQSKFLSFTRKLYRWGFRKTLLSKESDKGASVVAFGNIYFQRNNHALMSQMRSITAAKLRRKSSSLAGTQDLETTSANKNPSRHFQVFHSQQDEESSNLALMSPFRLSHADQGSTNAASMSASQQLQGDQLGSSLTLSQLQQLQGGQSSPDLTSLLQVLQFQGRQGYTNPAALAQLQQLRSGTQASSNLAPLIQFTQLQGDQTAARILSSMSQFQQLGGNSMNSGAAALPGSLALNASPQYIGQPQQLDHSFSVSAKPQSTMVNPKVLLALLLQSHSLQNPVQVQQLPTSINDSDQLNIVQRSLMQSQRNMNTLQAQGELQGQQCQSQGQQQEQVQRQQQPTQQQGNSHQTTKNKSS